MHLPVSSFARGLARFLREEDGPTAVEYAFLVALIFVVCVSAVQTIGGLTNNGFKAASKSSAWGNNPQQPPGPSGNGNTGP